MAEPGDPPVSDDPAPEPSRPAWSPPPRPAPSADDHAHDDLIGFTSSASLAAARREPTSARPIDDEPEQAGLFDAPVNRLAVARDARLAEQAAEREAAARPAVAYAADDDGVSIPTPTAPATVSTFGRAPAVKPVRTEAPEGAMGLFAVYALILFAVPTLGVAAAIALVAVTVRPTPQQGLARSHFEFQKRTLWIAAVAAVLGVVLIAVNLGVFVLFIVAVWLLARGAWGLLLLARGETIARPRQWLIAAR